MEQVYQCASNGTNSDLHSILTPWFTVRKVKVDVEVVNMPPFLPFLFLTGLVAFVKNSHNPL
jgi:hypothetical protein